MRILAHLNIRKLKAISTGVAVATVSGCAATPPSLIAGAPSTHTPQSYETISSTAAVTSTLGGSSIVFGSEPAVGGGLDITSVATSGSINHATGRLELDDGTYLFIDPDGPTIGGELDDGAGATGDVRYLGFSGAYDYVSTYRVSYNIDGNTTSVVGVAGMITGSSDMPSGGAATYTGDANVIYGALLGSGGVVEYEDGVSTVVVDFGAGMANVTLDTFANISSGGSPVLPANQPFDVIRGTGLVISGSGFGGGNWVTVKDNMVVEIVGASPVATGNGTFFGYDPSISAPDEVGGVFAIFGPTALVIGVYIAD